MLYSMKTGLCNKYLLSEIAAFFVRVVSQNITVWTLPKPTFTYTRILYKNIF